MKRFYPCLAILLCFKWILVASQKYTCPYQRKQLRAYISMQGTIKSPRYPSSYPSLMGPCSWLILVSYGYRVQLTFNDFDTYGFDFSDSCNSATDNLVIYDLNEFKSPNNVLGKYCGNYLPANVVSSSGTGLYLEFAFNSGSKTRRGFQLNFIAIKDTAEKPDVCSQFNSDSTNNNIQLNSSAKYKDITSPLYPQKYPSNVKCVWHITASSHFKRIQLVMSDVKIYNYKPSPCYLTLTSKDVLAVMDGSSINDNELKTACSHSSTATLTSTGRYMTILFRSNPDNFFTANKAGFLLMYKEIGQSQSPSLCTESNSFETNNDIRLKATESTKYIISPWYPHQYPAKIECTWYISASSSSKRVELTLSEVTIYNKYSYKCLYTESRKLQDALIVRDGSNLNNKVLKMVCNPLDSSTTIVSSGQHMTIEFGAHSNGYFNGSVARFKLEYKEFGEPTDANFGLIVGICIAVILAVALVIFCVCLIKRKRQATRRTRRAPVTRTPRSTTLTSQSSAPIASYPMQIQAVQPARGSGSPRITINESSLPPNTYVPPPTQGYYAAPSDADSDQPPEYSPPLPFGGNYFNDPPPPYPGLSEDTAETIPLVLTPMAVASSRHVHENAILIAPLETTPLAVADASSEEVNELQPVVQFETTM